MSIYTDSPQSASPALPSTDSLPKLTTALPQSGLITTLLTILSSSPCFTSSLTTPTFPFHTYANDLQLYLNCTDSPTYAPDRRSSCIKSIHQWLTSNSLKINPTEKKSIFLHIPLRYSTLPEPPPSHSTIPHSPTLNTSETLASILIQPFPLTPILYICTNPSTTTYTASA